MSSCEWADDQYNVEVIVAMIKKSSESINYNILAFRIIHHLASDQIGEGEVGPLLTLGATDQDCSPSFGKVSSIGIWGVANKKNMRRILSLLGLSSIFHKLFTCL